MMMLMVVVDGKFEEDELGGIVRGVPKDGLCRDENVMSVHEECVWMQEVRGSDENMQRGPTKVRGMRKSAMYGLSEVEGNNVMRRLWMRWRVTTRYAR